MASTTMSMARKRITPAKMSSTLMSRPVTLPPPEDGETQENSAKDELTSTDFAKLLAEGGTFTPPAGVERVELADGVLSYGTGTAEAFVARLYLGLLGREGDVEGLAFGGNVVEDGASYATLAGVFLSGAEYQASRGAARTDAAFVEGLLDTIRSGGLGEIDPSRLYAMGISSGGFMTSRR